jgi:hypothetical protein
LEDDVHDETNPTTDASTNTPEEAERRVGRRAFLAGAGLAGATIASAPLVGRASAATGPLLVRQPPVAGAPMAEQLHLQFGFDAARMMVASWSTPQRVVRPRVRFGTAEDGFGREVAAIEKTYTEAISGQTVFTYHAPMFGLHPSTNYVYEVFAAGAASVAGHFRTGPGHAERFRFTSFGDQSIPAQVGPGTNPGPWTVNAGFVVDAVEQLDPLFHLLNGDLCYANVSDDPVATWQSFFNNNMRSARNRPWMPAAGNHENELGNGPQGYTSYQTRFFLPPNGQPADFEGNWYWFKVGNVAVVSLNNDDVCIQAGSFSAFRINHLVDPSQPHEHYIRGYSNGAQKQWLEHTLQLLNHDDDIDWIVVMMHQVAMSSAHFNGADLGIRQEFVPLFEKYGVDLVVAGHEHHYERSHAVRGHLDSNQAPNGMDLLTPAPQTSDLDVIDTTKGTVHMIIGGGGHPSFTPASAFDMPHDGVVIYDVTHNPDDSDPSLTTTESAAWSALRDLQHPYGLCSFDVEPGIGTRKTSISVNFHGTTPGSSDYSQIFDSFTLERPHRHHRGLRF